MTLNSAIAIVLISQIKCTDLYDIVFIYYGNKYVEFYLLYLR